MSRKKESIINNSRFLVVVDVITIVCGVVALILVLNGGVGFDNPITWIICILLITTILSFVFHNSENKK